MSVTTKRDRVDRDEDSTEREPLSLTDYWTVAVRRRWYFLGPFFLLGLLGFGIARVWPVLYRSDALILVEQQRVPEQYVMPNVMVNLQTRLDGLTQRALSHDKLTSLILRFNLYPKERAHVTLDEVIDKMRKRIGVEFVQTQGRTGELTGFRIHFSADSPQVAQGVTSELTTFFLDANVSARTGLSDGTTSFLENQLAEATKDLAVQEKRLREYKLKFLGELPEQQQGNLQVLASLEAQLRSTADSVGRAEQQKVYLESLRAEYRALSESLTPEKLETKPVALASAEAALTDLQRQLSEMQSKYSPQHPDVVRLKLLIASYEELKKRLTTEASAGKKDDKKAPNIAAAPEQTLIEVESRLKAIDVDIQKQNKDAQELRREISEAQKHLNLTPVREQQLAEVTRTYENSRANYQSLLQKKLQSGLASELEKRQQGEKFQLLDAANLPEKPDWPNRVEITLYGWLLGMVLGIGLAALREISDQTIHGERDVRAQTDLLILARIPVMHSPREESRGRWWRIAEVALVVLLSLASIGTGIVIYLRA